jgi:uncharacterized protein
LLYRLIQIGERVSVWVLALLLVSCATYYQANQEFNRSFELGNMQHANQLLDKQKKAAEKKNRFLFYVNKGVVESMIGNYELSNEWFEKAYIYGEDFKKNAGEVAASFLMNPMMMTYAGEDHEHLFVLYYKALNYLKVGKNQEALVECRRLNNRLNELADKYKSENKYKEDAFIHNLMGIIYEADKDYNNAFIAYRNAHNIYKDSYLKLFGLGTPEQLKQDLIRSAMLTGFDEEADFYRREFGMEDYRPAKPGAEVVFFWHNGLGPVKGEWSLTFAMTDMGGGMMGFTNPEFGYSFSFSIAPQYMAPLSSLQVIRVAFPKYVDRPPIYHNGYVEAGGIRVPLSLGENVNAVARKTLEERMLAELTKGLARLAIKKAIENQARKQDDTLGMLVGVFNAATEKADTRNWQTIPNSIFYARVAVQPGQNQVNLVTNGNHGTRTETFTFEVGPNQTVFHSYQTLDSYLPN